MKNLKFVYSTVGMHAKKNTFFSYFKILLAIFTTEPLN